VERLDRLCHYVRGTRKFADLDQRRQRFPLSPQLGFQRGQQMLSAGIEQMQKHHPAGGILHSAECFRLAIRHQAVELVLLVETHSRSQQETAVL
jgi:hypothetical protein